ncbi:TPA: phage tail protein [Streptococcus agalactiae]|nr:N-acetylmuramoyl-L-alanine amidase [Streptococcus agalactiae]
MTTFLDHKDNEFEAQAVVKTTNAVNGERSLSGTIYTNEEVLNKVDKGWKLEFDDEYYKIIYAKPTDTGNKIQVEFDAVHQFFYDFDKSSLHKQLNDGSHTFQAYLNFIFDGSGYTYSLEVVVGAFEKQSFGYKSRLDLFNDIIKSSGVEFFVRGKVVRILQKTGTDLSTIVRKNFNMNEIIIEKKINDFITYQKGFGAWNDKDDHSKGRVEVEYESPLVKEYGRIEGEPVVDERYTNADNLKSVLKRNVDSSYNIAIKIDIEDLTKAGYHYTQPIAGDYIMAINETLGFKEKIRIVSFESEYDVTGQLINHKVTCNDIGAIKKQTVAVSQLSKRINDNQEILDNAVFTANQALVSADGKNTNYYGTEMPVDNPKGTLRKGDLLFLTVGDTTKQYYWNGTEWIINPFSNDIDFVKKEINEKITEVNAAMKIADEQLTEKYNAIVAKNVSQDELINQAKTLSDSAKKEATEALTNLISESKKLTDQMSALSKTEVEHYSTTNQQLTQIDGTVKGLQTSYEALLKKDGDITQALANYKQTIDQNSASIITNKKTADNALSSLQTQVIQTSNEITTRLSQTNIEALITSKSAVIADNKVKETADSFSRELTRVNNTIDNLKIGTVNLLSGTKGWTKNWFNRNNWQADDDSLSIGNFNLTVLKRKMMWIGISQSYAVKSGESYVFSAYAKSSIDNDVVNLYLLPNDQSQQAKISISFKSITLNTDWQRIVIKFNVNSDGYILPRFERFNENGWLYIAGYQLEHGNVTSDYSESPADQEDKMTVEFNKINDTVNSHSQLIGKQNESLTATIQKVDNIQSTVSNVDGRLSRVTQTADGIVATVSQLDNNILPGTKKFTGWQTEGAVLEDLTQSPYSFVFKKWVSGNKVSPLIEYDVKKDQEYTFTAYISREQAGNLYFYLYDLWNHHITSTTPRETIIKDVTQTIRRFKITFIPTRDGKIRPRFAMLASDPGSFSTGGFMLSKGTVELEWSESKQDIKDSVTAINTTVTQTANSWAIKNLTSSGTVLSQLNLTDGNVKLEGKLIHLSGQSIIDNGIITNAMIKDLTADKITAGTIDANRINVINLDASNITSGRMSADLIRSGVLISQNGAMLADLNTGQIEFYTDSPAIKRINAGYPNQFVKFVTGNVEGKGQAGVTIIGSNRWGSESSNDGGFVGIRAWNGKDIDNLDLVGDSICLASSAYTNADGWEIITLPNQLSIDARNINHRVTSKIKVGDIWLWKNTSTYASIKDTINMIIDNLQLLHNNKTTEKGYSYTIPGKI